MLPLGFFRKAATFCEEVFVLNQKDTASYITYVSLEGGIVVDDPWRYEPLEKRAEG